MSRWELLTPNTLQSATWREDGQRRFCTTVFGTVYEASGDYFLADGHRETRLQQDGDLYLREIEPGSFEGPVGRLVHDGPWDAVKHALKRYWPLLAVCYLVAMVAAFTGQSRVLVAATCIVCLMLALSSFINSKGIAKYLKAALLAPLAYGLLFGALQAAKLLLTVLGFPMGLVPIEALTGYFSGE